MAYRRKHGTPRASTFEDFTSNPSVADDDVTVSSPASLAAKAIRASAAHRESSLSSAYADSAFASSNRDPMRQRSVSFSQTPVRHEYTSVKSMNERNINEDGFWGLLARKAKSLLEDDNAQFNEQNRAQKHDKSPESQFTQPDRSPENNRKAENIASSLNYIGGTIRNALEEGLTIVENRTADIIQETKKLQISRKSVSFNPRSKFVNFSATEDGSQHHCHQENQLKESREVANAMAAKAKLLLRELKTLKADLDFAKQRCSHLEEENKLLRENCQKGDNTEDDDLIRLQLEALLAEKGRLAHENSIYARENRFLREIVEYHQLTMQDLLSLGDGIDEDVAEVGKLRLSSPNSSRSTSGLLAPAVSSPHSSQNTDAEAESSSPVASAPNEDTHDAASLSSSPKFDDSPRRLSSSP
ncbi:hypothetical protein HPP92_017468 [Vanilla planifolia]|uniref:Uncharacterized protein n=1 Tax=Vanilla planifolia TaxID=51239 RepID=A0A835Q816_VANPL|nr:hypothetical protein HPP92_017468 [Vanilla planifolia]